MDLLQSISSTLDQRVLRRAGSLFGESEHKLRSASQQLIPAVVAAAINLTGSPEGSDRLFSLIQTGRHNGKMLSELESQLTSKHCAAALLSFGEQTCKYLLQEEQFQAIQHVVHDELQLNQEITKQLLSLISFVLLEQMGKVWRTPRLHPFDLIAWLQDHRRATARVLPAEIARYVELYENPRQVGIRLELPVKPSILKLFRIRG